MGSKKGDLQQFAKVRYGSITGVGVLASGGIPYTLMTNTLPNTNLSGTYDSGVSLTSARNVFTGDGFALNYTLSKAAGGVLDISGANVTGTIASARISGTYSNALRLPSLGNQFYGDGTGLNFSYTNATGTLPNTNLSGTYGTGVSLTSDRNVFTGDGLALNYTLSKAVAGTLDISGANVTGTIASARISGSYTLITGVGALTTGGVPSTLLTGTIAASNITSVPTTSLTGTLHTSNLTGTYSGNLVFSGTNNNYTGASVSLTRDPEENQDNVLRVTQNTASDAVQFTKYQTGNGGVLYLLQYGVDSVFSAIQTTNNDGAKIVHNNTGSGSALNVTSMGSDQALGVQQYGNAEAVQILKMGTGSGAALVIENSGTGVALELIAVGNGNATISSSTGSGHWIQNNTRAIYANGSVDVTHGANSVQIDNSAVTANSIILLSMSGGDAGVPVNFWVNARTARNHFNVTVVNASARTGLFWISYVMIN